MPNTPAMVLEAMSALTPNDNVTPEELDTVISIFNSFGKCEVVPETLMDAVTGVSGSSPAYVYMFIEAMADAAVWDGMPRAQAYKFAAQSVLGAAKMVLETGKHPGELKDAVCSRAEPRSPQSQPWKTESAQHGHERTACMHGEIKRNEQII